MTCKISRPVFAMVLALGMLAALSNPGHAALSTADRTSAAAAPAQTQTLATASTPAPVTLAVAAPAEVVAAPVAAQPRKTIAHKAKPQRFAAFSRAGYPCH